MDASEADSGGGDVNVERTGAENETGPENELVIDLPDPNVYRRAGQDYRAGDRPLDGREVLAVDDGIPTLSKRPGGAR